MMGTGVASKFLGCQLSIPRSQLLSPFLSTHYRLVMIKGKDLATVDLAHGCCLNTL